MSAWLRRNDGFRLLWDRLVLIDPRVVKTNELSLRWNVLRDVEEFIR